MKNKFKKSIVQRYISYSRFWLSLCCIFTLAACGKFKEDFLNIKQNPNIVTPSNIQDYQALLDNATNNIQTDAWMNFTTSHRLGIIGSDEFYVLDSRYTSLSDWYVYEKNAYIWKKDFYDLAYEIRVDDWFNGYKRIYYCNLVLDGIGKLTPSTAEKTAWNNVKGSALFYRALNFYDLAQEYCKPYNPETAESDLGIALRKTYEVTERSVRATVAETYQQIIQDLEAALPLLPDYPLANFRPSKLSVYALLARTYVQMENFEQVLHFSDLALKLKDDLTDYNTLDKNADFSFTNGDIGTSNAEVFYYCGSFSSLANQAYIQVDTNLMNSYDVSDLRFSMYYRKHTNGNIMFKGSFSGDGNELFTGFATDELWLMRAEAYARLEQVDKAMADLNHLLKHRYDSEAFVPLAATTPYEALRLVLEHRRKELVLRGVRWSDLRRLNKDPRFAKTLVRVVEGVRHELPPGDNRWVWPIPLEEIDLSNMEQNPR